MKKTTNEKFSLASLYGKTVAIADDIKNGKDVDTGLLKTIISGDGITAEHKFENEFEFEPYATFLIGMNNIVTFNDSSDGFARRFLVVPFKNKFKTGKNRNIKMKEILCSPDNLKYICSKAVYYFSKAIEQEAFTIPKCVRAETTSYLLENRHIKMFLYSFPLGKVETSELYPKYVTWCKNNGFTPLKKRPFENEIKNYPEKIVKGRYSVANADGLRTYYYEFLATDEDDEIAGVLKDDSEEDEEVLDVRNVNINLEQIVADISSDIQKPEFDVSALSEFEDL